MLIDRKGINNTFEVTPEMLFGRHPSGWVLVCFEDKPIMADAIRSSIAILNRPAGVTNEITVTFNSDNTWAITVKYTPEIHPVIVLKGEMGGSKHELLINVYRKFGKTAIMSTTGLSSIIIRLVGAMYDNGNKSHANIKYDSDIPRCDELVLDPQHYSISRILDSIGRSLKLACIDNTYINISQSVIDMILDDHDIGYSKFKVHVHDKRLINALTDLGYDVEILDNHGAVDCIRISGWAKGGIEND